MEEYNHKKIEAKWQKYWEENKFNQVDLDKAKKPFYNLMMFPYPSAEGLHVGNMYAFVHSDAYGRFMKLQGNDVFEPIGLDGFGIHSENYAIKIKEHIKTVSQRTEKHFYEQLHMIGNQYDWSRTVETYKPNYYKWTQWLFLQMYKKGLAYRAQAPVNWCPSCKTVLSDEQVISGRCERCNSETEKRQMEQWFFKITDYAERLLKNLEWIDWSEPVKIGQRNWIGKSEGASLKFSIANSSATIEVFTTRPDTLFGATFMVLCPEHQLIEDLEDKIENLKEVKEYIKKARQKSDLERTDLNKDKTGIEIKGMKAINPANNKEIPIFVADYVLSGYGTGAIMAVPAHDERDWEFAKKYRIEIIEVVKGGKDVQKEVYTGSGVGVNSEFLNNLETKEAMAKMIEWLEKKKIGKGAINYKIRDWCVSRQRYWGPPIPMIYCEKCGWQPEKDLPVLLPEMDNFLPDGSGKGPLNKIKEFVETVCPKCGGVAKRETDVSDPFVDSCWYYLRYPCTEFDNQPFDKNRLAKWMPVNMYIGGKEHTVLHLLYSRFITMVMHDLGYLKEEEPFKRFFAHGLLIKEGAKMSKSKGNIINPDEYIEKFGADSVRLYLMFLGDVRVGGDWRDSGINGMSRFVKRVWNMYEEFLDNFSTFRDAQLNIDSRRKYVQLIKKVADDINNMKFNTAIAEFMKYVNYITGKKTKGAISSLNIESAFGFLKLLHPFAPFISSELFEQIQLKDEGKSGSNNIALEGWPEYDKNLIKDETIQMPIQINGKVRVVLTVPADISEDEAKKLALADDNIKKWLEDKEPKKVIFVKGRLVNIVA